MRHLHLSVLFCAITMSMCLSAQSGPTYLSNLTPTDYRGWKQTEDMSGGRHIELGGIKYTNFISIRTLSSDRQGFAEYSLKGKYSTLQFIYATETYKSHKKNAAFLVTGDGRPLLDKVVPAGGAVPTRVTLDVSGVDKLRIEIVSGDTELGICDPTLWTAAQQVKEIGKVTLAQNRPTKLVSELRPYYQDTYHACISDHKDDKKHEVQINGITYTSGVEMNAYQRMSGNGEAQTLFNLGGMYKQLSFIAGPTNMGGGTLGTGWITIKSDGKILYELEVKEDDIAKQVWVNISGCKLLCIESQNEKGSLMLAATDIMVYPAGTEPKTLTRKFAEENVGSEKYRQLPDVCKLISNIPPYAMAGKSTMGNNLYDGRSQNVTFSMGGTKFWEGFILQSSSTILNDNTGADVAFYLAGEFDYVSFTSGWVSKCGILKNDTLVVYADNKVVLYMPLIATHPNQHYVVPINKCQRLIFQKRGMQSLAHPVFGVADLVVYRGEPVENNLFVHPTPELPDEIDLLELGKPYIHYATPMKDFMSDAVRDGSTRKEFFELNGERIYSGFLLQTSVHFDLDAGVGGGASGAAVASAGLGASFMIGTVGSATVSVVCPFGALLILAAGGSGYENSCAAFNTYGAYNTVTFTVAPYTSYYKKKETETLKIGGDGEVIKEFKISADMPPTTFTVTINKCEQLMFWMECGDSTSERYLFYDITLQK
ncbi:MAG: NPCBM/NEW2 domain-containing protein [Paludibacteraceae bacterium]|nr:NPCBM/NEW2 domain-containing protein [Paludibacteraceae bacterium]